MIASVLWALALVALMLILSLLSQGLSISQPHTYSLGVSTKYPLFQKHTMAQTNLDHLYDDIIVQEYRSNQYHQHDLSYPSYSTLQFVKIVIH